MGDAVSDLKYDPELPFAYLDTTGSEVYARFKHRSDAEVFRERCNFGLVVDTTPKPKIPEDAQHITWGEGRVAYSRYDGKWVGWNHGYAISEQELLTWIGNAEVTVRVRKEEP